MSSADKYGLKEVADVYFIAIDEDVARKDVTAIIRGSDLVFFVGGKEVAKEVDNTDSSKITPKFVFDTLKTSNIEVASEETSAKGGKGNPELISWSYGKTATITVTDALLSLNTLGMLFGAKELKAGGISDTLTIDANTFPNNYMILGTTVLRPFTGGDDEPFGFVIPQAKINVGGTLTMEAEGDPSTFEMSIKALAAYMGEQKDILLKFIKPSKEGYATLKTTLGASSTTGVVVNFDGFTSGDTCEGSDDLDITSAAGSITIAKASGATLTEGSVYHCTIKNGSTVKAIVEVTIG